MKTEKYKQYLVTKQKYPGDFSWVTFYSPSNESGVKPDEYIRSIAECRLSEMINLSGNNLYRNPSLLISAVRSIQDSAHTVDLSFNGLNQLSDENWIHLSTSLPFNISTVNLSNNKLGEWGFEQFKNNINLIPSYITEILIYNTPLKYPEAELQEFLASHDNRIKIGPIPEQTINSLYGLA